MTEADPQRALKDGIEALIAMRVEMLKAGNKAEADRLRDQLASQGIQLKDSKDSTTGSG